MTGPPQKLRIFVLLTAAFAGMIFFTTFMSQFAAYNLYQRIPISLIAGVVAFGAIWLIYFVIRFIVHLFGGGR